MSKLLNTLNGDTIYDSLEVILGVPREFIENYVLEKVLSLIRSNSESNSLTAESINIDEFFNFLSKYTKQPLMVDFDEITVSHLTSRITEDSIKSEPLYNLFNALLKETEIKRFLYENAGLSFWDEKGKIVVKCDGKIVNWKDYTDTYEGAAAQMVINRLEGYSSGEVDKCVNGFLFNGEIYKNGDVEHLLRFPEILENMLRLLGKSNIANMWAGKSDSYIITFKTNINNIFFDGHHRLNNKQKRYRILKHCLFFLINNMLGDWDEDDNPIIRLKDNLDVPYIDIINVYKIER